MGIKKCFLFFALMVCGLSTAFAQNNKNVSGVNPLAYLENTFPKLTSLYREELSKYPAHYIFAVDVSGTMNQFAPAVVSSLQPFFQALPDRDRVDVIPFGTDALPGMVSYAGIIDPSVRQALCGNIGRLYNDPSYADGFKSYTDVQKAVEAIAKVIQNNREYKVNVIVILTDFRNDVPGPKPTEHKFDANQLDHMNQSIAAATNDVYTRCVALELPVDHSKPGYCLQQLKSEVFPQDGSGLEIVPLTNPGQMIGQWFEQLKREIMVTKLRAIITDENKVNPARLIVDTDIDGNVNAEIHWSPSKLYPSMRIDSTYVGQEGFVFENNKKAYENTRDSVIGVDPELLLGKIVNESYGFHNFNDSIHLGIDLPTEYDNELASLGVKKPIPATTRGLDKWIFTFFLPFWLTALIIALIILYLIGVFKAVGRNNKYKLSGKVTVSSDGEPLDGFPTRITPCESVSIGCLGTGKLKIQDVNWNVQVVKVNGCIWKSFFSKPHFEWRGTKGFVQSGDKSSYGVLDYGSTMAVRGGKNRNEIENAVRMQIIQQ